MNTQLPLVFTAGQMSEATRRYIQQLPDAPNCPRCQQPRVTDWLGVHIHTDTMKQTCQEETTP